MDHDELDKTLSDVNKLCELIQKLNQENEKKEKSLKYQKKHKGSLSTLCINVNKHYKKFDELKNHLPAIPNSDDVVMIS
ncbi:14769_t:CDS:2, partial [Cetraspora pellucida]